MAQSERNYTQNEPSATMAAQPKQQITKQFTIRCETIYDVIRSIDEPIVGCNYMGFKCTEVIIESLPNNFWQWIFRRGQRWLVECKYEKD